MSNGPWGIVVVRVSWPGHPHKLKKKKEFARNVITFRRKGSGGLDCKYFP
jgi:hypothetical protein